MIMYCTWENASESEWFCWIRKRQRDFFQKRTVEQIKHIKIRPEEKQKQAVREKLQNWRIKEKGGRVGEIETKLNSKSSYQKIERKMWEW